MTRDRVGGVPLDGGPFDLAQLARQTQGDGALQAELMVLFANQLGEFRDALADGDAARRCEIVHAVKGSARSLGAVDLADSAADLEAHPADEDRLRFLMLQIDKVRSYVRDLQR